MALIRCFLAKMATLNSRPKFLPRIKWRTDDGPGLSENGDVGEGERKRERERKREGGRGRERASRLKCTPSAVLSSGHNSE